jgi:hypothetical protein
MGTIIRGRVVDGAGRPVADAAVYFVESPGGHPDIAQLTSDDGRFALPDVTPPGLYRVGARAFDGQGVAEVLLLGNEASAEVEIRIGSDS